MFYLLITDSKGKQCPLSCKIVCNKAKIDIYMKNIYIPLSYEYYICENRYYPDPFVDMTETN